jgi:uncharacterized protein (TIGR04255 family)
LIFDFPDADRRYRLARSPLARAIAVVRYPLVAAFGNIAGMRGLQESLQDAFPTLTEAPARQVEVTITPTGVTHNQQDLPQWNFSGHESHFDFSVTSAFAQLAVAGENYEDRARFAGVLQLVLDALHRNGVRQVDVFAVRYINASAVEPGWEARWNPAVVGWINDPAIHAPLRNSMNQTLIGGAQVRLPGGNDVLSTAVIRHGVVSGVGPEIMQNATTRPAFILDAEISATGPMPLVTQTLLDLFRQFNHELAHFMYFALTQVGREHFGMEFLR